MNQLCSRTHSLVGKTVIAIIEGSQVIPYVVVKCVKFKVKAPVSNDICINNISYMDFLDIETTLSRLKEGHISEVVVVITSGAPKSLKHGMSPPLLLFDYIAIAWINNRK